MPVTRGELIVTPGRAVSVEALLLEALDRWSRPAAIVADRYRETDLRQALDRAGFPQAAFTVRGMGFKDGAEDVRLFRRACLTERVAPGRSLLLRAALSEARTVADPAGNEKLAKGVEGGRRRRAREGLRQAGYPQRRPSRFRFRVGLVRTNLTRRRTTMTQDMMTLRALLEKSSDADLLREMTRRPLRSWPLPKACGVATARARAGGIGE